MLMQVRRIETNFIYIYRISSTYIEGSTSVILIKFQYNWLL